MSEYINDFIVNWNKNESERKENDPDFIKHFYDFASSSDPELWEFSGENGYCGYTATLSEYGSWVFRTGNDFEFAYSKTFVKVFTARHEGFWVPEYISLSGPEAKPLLCVIESKLIEWAGFGDGQ